MSHPEIIGWSDGITAAYDEVVARLDGGVLVEVGTYLGKSLCHLGQIAKGSGKLFMVVGVDTCRGSGEEQHVGNVHAEAVARGGGTFAGELHKNLLDRGLDDVVLLVAKSVQASTLFADRSLDFVFIDAAHTYDAVCLDIACWLPKVRPGGVLAGHDYGPPWEDVVKAVDETLARQAERWHGACWKYEVPA